MGNNASLVVDASYGPGLNASAAAATTSRLTPDSGATRRPYSRAHKLTKTMAVKHHLDGPASAPTVQSLRQRKQAEFKQRLQGKSWVRLSRRQALRPAPVDIPVSAEPVSEGADPSQPWSDVRIEDYIPQAPPPPAPEMGNEPGQHEQQQRRRSMFRSMSMRDQSEDREQRTSSFLRNRSKSRTRDMNSGRAYSMSASTAAESFAGEGYVPQVIESTRYAMSKRNTIIPTSSAVESPAWAAQRRLSQMPYSPTEPDHLSPTENASQSSHSRAQSESRSNSLVRMSHNAAFATRTESDASLYTPMRRRSMVQTPGVATRTPRAPQAGARYSMPPTPNSISRRTSFDFGPVSGRTTRAASMTLASQHPSFIAADSLAVPKADDGGEVVRVLTPCEEDYRQLGVMKFGSLRIVNGSPIRSPDFNDSKQPWGVAAAVAKRHSDPVRGSEVDNNAEDDSDDVLMMKAPKPKSYKPCPAPDSLLGEPFTMSPVAVAASPRKLQGNGNGAHAQFLADMTFTPFTITVPRLPPLVLPELEVTTRVAALDADLFEDAASPITAIASPFSQTTNVTPTAGATSAVEYFNDEVLSVREDPSAKQQRCKRSESTQQAPTVSRSDSGIVTSPVPSPVSGVSLSKTDSGYSSNASLRSIWGSRGSSMTSRWRSSSKPAAEGRTKRESSTTRSRRPTEGEEDREAPCLGTSQQREAESVSTWSPHRAWLSVKRRSSSTHRKSAAAAADGSQSTTMASGNGQYDGAATPSGAVTPSDGSSTSDASTQRPSRLKRLLSGARISNRAPPVPPIPDSYTPEHGAPRLSLDLEDKPEEPVVRFPTMTNRFALRVQPSKATLQTIFSVGSMEFSGIDGTDMQGRKSLQSLVQAASVATVGGAPATPVTAGSLGPSAAVRPASGPRIKAIKTGVDGKFSLSLSPVLTTPTTPTITATTATASKTTTPTVASATLAPGHKQEVVANNVGYFPVFRGSQPTNPPTLPPKPSASGSAPPVSLYTRNVRSNRAAPATLRTNNLCAEPSSRVEPVHATHVAQCARDGFAWLPPHKPVPKRSPSMAQVSGGENASPVPAPNYQRTMSLVSSRFDGRAAHTAQASSAVDSNGRSLSFTSSPSMSYRSPTNFQVASGSHNCGTPRLPPAMPELPSHGRQSQMAPASYDSHRSPNLSRPARNQNASTAGAGTGTGSQPSFRTLHSYNSPAYRNAPVWG